MSHVKTLKTILSTNPSFLTIKEHTSFGEIFAKIKKSKNIDFVLVKKPILNQMAAVLALRLTGKKFFWVQNFTNPPTPGFFSRLLIAQADRIIAGSKKEAFKLKRFGIDKAKIRIQKISLTVNN